MTPAKVRWEATFKISPGPANKALCFIGIIEGSETVACMSFRTI